MPRRTNTLDYDRAFRIGFSGMVFLVPMVFVWESAFIAYYPKLFLFQCAVLYLFLIGVLKQRTSPILAVRTSPFVLPVVFYLTLMLLSILQAINRIEALVQISHQFTLTLLFLILLNDLRSQDLLRYLKPIALSGTAIALIGIIQYLGLGLLWIPSAGFPSATLGYRNYAAMVMLLTIPAGIRLLLQARGFQFWVWGLAVVCMVAFLTCTRTRGAWVGMFTACVIAAIAVAILRATRRPRQETRNPGQPRPYLYLTITGIALIAILAYFEPFKMGKSEYQFEDPRKIGVRQTLSSIVEEGGDKGRLAIWRNTLEMIADHFLSGVGTGNWQIVYPLYDRGDTASPQGVLRRPHNDYLWIASELGLPGLFAFLWVTGLALFRCFRLAASAKTYVRLWTPVCLGTALLAIMGHAFFSFPRERITPSMLFWITLAFVAILDAEQHPPRPIRRIRVWNFAHITTCFLLLLGIWISLKAVAFDRHYARADTYANEAPWKNLISEATAALRHGVFDPQILVLRSVGYYSQGNFALAEADNRRARSYHPNLINALNNSGLVYNAQRKYDQALSVLRRALDIAPKHAEAHANSGVAYQGLGRLEDAVAEFKKALEQAPNHAQFRYYLGAAYEGQGNLDSAAAIYTRLLDEDDRNAATHYRLGAVYQKQQRLDDAISEFEKTLRINPTYLPAYAGLGDAYTLRGDTARAEEAYTTFLKRWRGNPRAAQNIRERLDNLRRHSEN